jgi:heme exporter protein D
MRSLFVSLTYPSYIDIDTRAKFLRLSAMVVIVTSSLFAPVFIYFGYIAPTPGIPSVAWVPWAMLWTIFICVITIILSRYNLISVGVILLTGQIMAIDIWGSRPYYLLNSPSGAMFSIPIIIAGLVGGIGASVVLCSAIIFLFAILPFFTNATWTPYTTVNVAINLLSVAMIWITQHFIKKQYITNIQLRETNEREQRTRAFMYFFQHELNS